MIIYGLQNNNQFVGFGLTDNILTEQAPWSSTSTTIVSLGEGNDEVVRNIVDYFTAKLNGSAATPDQYGIVDGCKFTEQGLALWVAYTN